MSEKMGTGYEDERVNNIEQAWAGANAEKPLRDLAREEEISEEEKMILDRLAERRGEKAMQEYETEKEKNPMERLLSRVDQIAAEMRTKGLEEDAVIVEKIKSRFDRYVEVCRNKKDKLEDHLGRRVKPGDVFQNHISNSIPVVRHSDHDKHGWVYSAGGIAESPVGAPGSKEDQTQPGAEIIDYVFSKAGETEFYRAIGVLDESEEAIDIPAIYQKAAMGRKNKDLDSWYKQPWEYRLRFPTDIAGVRVLIAKSRSFGDKDQMIKLEFEDKFMEEILNKK